MSQSGGGHDMTKIDSEGGEEEPPITFIQLSELL